MIVQRRFRPPFIFGVALAATMICITALYFVLFICAKLEDWPYYTPEMEGGRIRDVDRPHRWGNGPTAYVPLEEGSEVSAQAFCYPRQKNGSQGCLLRIGLHTSQPSDARFASTAISALQPDGGELIDGEFHPKYSDEIPFGLYGTILLKSGDKPEWFDLSLPDIQMAGNTYTIPKVRFIRVETSECVPLFINF